MLYCHFRYLNLQNLYKSSCQLSKFNTNLFVANLNLQTLAALGGDWDDVVCVCINISLTHGVVKFEGGPRLAPIEVVFQE
jgi:hypothetical protein